MFWRNESATNLLFCASLFLFYFVYVPFLLLGWKGWSGPGTGGAAELLMNHRCVPFFCWFGCAELFFLRFGESMKNPCQAPVKSHGVSPPPAPRGDVFPSRSFSLQRVCSPPSSLLPARCPHTVPLTLPSEPGLAPRGPKGKGRLSVSVPCDICPAISLTISCLKRRLWHFFPTDPFRGEKDAPGRTQCFFASSFRAGRWS